MMRGASRCEEPKTPVVASVPAARAATVAAPSRAVRMSWTLGLGDACLCARPRPAVIRLAARRSQLHVAEQRERGLDDLRLVREGDLLERLGGGHRQGGARGARGRGGGEGGRPPLGPPPRGRGGAPRWPPPPRRP